MNGRTDAEWLPEIPGRWPVTDSAELAAGRIVSYREDTVRMPDGKQVRREYIEHPGAVAVVAIDEAGRVLMIRQYRHAAGWQLWEVPAGLRDAAGEPPLETAKRELAEEAGYRAARWRELADFYTSPGISSERLIVYLAGDLEPVPEGELDYQRVDEEAHLLVEWVPLETVVSRFLAGQLRNGVMAVGVLAAYAATRDGGPGPGSGHEEAGVRKG
jgi:8-oxo-dGDP phosphatase